MAATYGTYGISLWDHEITDEDGHEVGDFSEDLAREFLGGRNRGLGRRELAQALKRLRSYGWSEVTIYVWREES